MRDMDFKQGIGLSSEMREQINSDGGLLTPMILDFGGFQ